MTNPFRRNRSHKVHDTVIYRGNVCEIIRTRRDEHRTTWFTVSEFESGRTHHVPACVINR